jgi:hypothetical protein
MRRACELIDQTLHTVAGAIDRAIKRAGAVLVVFARDGVPNMPTPQIGANLVTTLAFVAAAS